MKTGLQLLKCTASLLLVTALVLLCVPAAGGGIAPEGDYAGADKTALVAEDDEITLEYGSTGVAGAGAGEGRGILAYGMDVSAWQGCIDWEAVSADGIDYVILRIGLTDGMDSYFETNYYGAKRAGLGVGGYFYTKSSDSAGALSDAEKTISWIKGKQFDYPVYYDIENAAQSGMTKSERTQFCLTYCDRLSQAGYMTGLYASQNAMNNRFDVSLIGEKYELWMARWPASGLPTSDYSTTRGMWQYTDSGKVDGIDGAVDLDVSYRDYPAVMTLSGQNGYTSGKLTDECYPTGWYTVSASTLNVRAGADSSSAKLGKLTSGALVKITALNGVWGQLDYNGTQGWLCMYYLRLYANDAFAGRYVCTAGALNIRDDRSSDGNIVGTLSRNDGISLLGTFADWGMFRLSDQYVWASMSYLARAETVRDYETQLPDTSVSISSPSGESGLLSGVAASGDIMATTAGTVIELTVFVSDAQAVSELYFDVGSSGAPQGSCVRYTVRPDSYNTYSTGWNRLCFVLCNTSALSQDGNGEAARSVSDSFSVWLAPMMTGNIDASALNYFAVGYTADENAYISLAGENIFSSMRLITHTVHTFTRTSTLEADCVKCGEAVSNCTLCGAHVRDEIPASGHDYRLTETVEPGEHTVGKNTYTCSKCGDKYTDLVPPTAALSGDLNLDNYVGSTDAILMARYLASWSGYTVTDEIKALGDLNGDGELTVVDSVILSRYLAGWIGYETLPVTGN